MSGSRNAFDRPGSLVPDDNPLTAGAPTWADAYSQSTSALGQWLAEQRAKSSQMGLWNDQTGLPTGAGLVDAGRQYAEGILMGSTAPRGVRAYHGSPYDFNAFDTSKIGTGEGAQAYGHGLYFAEKEGTARSYRDKLATQGEARFIDTPEGRVAQDADIEDLTPHQRALLLTANSGGDTALALHTAESFAQNPYSGSLWPDVVDKLRKTPDAYHGTRWQMPGKMYEVNIGADPEHFLHWDKPLSEQHPVVQDAVKKAGLVDPKPTVEWKGDPSLWELHQNGRPTGTMLEDAGDGRTYNEIVNGKPTGSIPKQSLDAWKEMHAQSLRDAYRDPDPMGRDIVKNNPGVEKELHTIGLPGIKYLDQGSRGGGEGTHNYVVFDAATIDILRKYGLAGLMAGGAATGATSGNSE